MQLERIDLVLHTVGMQQDVEPLSSGYGRTCVGFFQRGPVRSSVVSSRASPINKAVMAVARAELFVRWYRNLKRSKHGQVIGGGPSLSRGVI